MNRHRLQDLIFSQYGATASIVVVVAFAESLYVGGPRWLTAALGVPTAVIAFFAVVLLYAMLNLVVPTWPLWKRFRERHVTRRIRRDYQRRYANYWPRERR